MKKIIIFVFAVILSGCVPNSMKQPITITEVVAMGDKSCRVQLTSGNGSVWWIYGPDCNHQVGEVWLNGK